MALHKFLDSGCQLCPFLSMAQEENFIQTCLWQLTSLSELTGDKALDSLQANDDICRVCIISVLHFHLNRKFPTDCEKLGLFVLVRS